MIQILAAVMVVLWWLSPAIIAAVGLYFLVKVRQLRWYAHLIIIASMILAPLTFVWSTLRIHEANSGIHEVNSVAAGFLILVLMAETITCVLFYLVSSVVLLRERKRIDLREMRV